MTNLQIKNKTNDKVHKVYGAESADGRIWFLIYDGGWDWVDASNYIPYDE